MPLSVDAQFTSLMDDMADFSDKIQNYIRDASVQRLWMVPEGKDTMWEFDPTDPTDMYDPFDRDAIRTDYSNEYSGSGTNEIRAVMGTNVEIGYMAMMERAFRERHKLCPRALLHVAGRRLAHSHTSDGVHKAAVEGYVSDLFNA